MTPKRSRLEIYIDVLRIISKGTRKPTRIMYGANLSWNPLNSVLRSMLKQDLIRQKREGRHSLYWITNKGSNVLNYFNEAIRQIEIQI